MISGTDAQVSTMYDAAYTFAAVISANQTMHSRMASKNLKSKIYWYIVTKVREMRSLKVASQEDIAIHLNLSTGFIGHIESQKFIAKYNTFHLNELAKFFQCSTKDFWPELPF